MALITRDSAVDSTKDHRRTLVAILGIGVMLMSILLWVPSASASPMVVHKIGIAGKASGWSHSGRIKNARSGKCVHLRNHRDSVGTIVRQYTCHSDFKGQHWQVLVLKRDKNNFPIVQIRSTRDYLCMEPAKKAKGANVVLGHCKTRDGKHRPASTRWRVAGVSEGVQVKISNRWSHKCLGLGKHRKKNNTHLKQHRCVPDAPYQKWDTRLLI